ncbi:putative NTE family protein [termite gut metagenome]|uniref:Putative NTE family protein n=1 Tax=termite gut metagenome TaxID=433724 RepID=A0A5J4RUD1_9ZZZZ
MLSGGGAKGLTHIGIIRALEENHIPIDYITGTSIGAVIGSLYAMGYTPDEMIALIRSEKFKLWYSGEVEGKYVYYFRKNRDTPELYNASLSFRKTSKTIKPQLFPGSVVNPIQMNLVFLEMYAGATSACGGDFDRLFVPFRCVASDIYYKRPIVMREGNLGDAVRASMSFPLIFKPTRINGVLAYDGGLYDNFPSDVMIDDFKPDIIIGSVVADDRVEAEESDLMGQLNNMIMDKGNYQLPDSLGILMSFKYNSVGLLDFQKIDELTSAGYNYTINLMDSIKKRITRRVDPKSLHLQRAAYRKTYPELRFRNIYIQEANLFQQEYIRKEFRRNPGDDFTYEDLKSGYFRLLSGNAFSEIIPQAAYNPATKSYDLYLDVKMKDELSLYIGGSVSTANSNQIYLGGSYQDLHSYAKEFILDGQIGRIYNNLQFAARVDFNAEIPKSLRFITSISSFDYFKKEKLFSRDFQPAFVKKDEDFAKLKLAMPFLQSRKAEFGLVYGYLKDDYFQNSTIDFEKDKYDESDYRLSGASISFKGSTLNSRQYATRGYSEMLVAQIFTGKELFRSGLQPLSENQDLYEQQHTWLQLSYDRESYHRITSKYTLGWAVKVLYASKNFSENYTATLLQAGEFTPTPHSMITYNGAFRANQYVAGGIKPIYHLTDRLHTRAEFYGFLPIFPIERNSINKAYYGKAFSRFECLGEVSLVYQLSFGAISVYANRYSSPKKEWNVGVTLGWTLFNDRFIE